MPPKRAAPGTTNGTTQPALPNDDISDIGSDAEVSEEDDEDEQTTGLKFQPLEKLRGATYKQHSIADLVRECPAVFTGAQLTIFRNALLAVSQPQSRVPT